MPSFLHTLRRLVTHKKHRRIYLDYAAASPVRREVLDAMQPYFSDIFANPSAIHEEGQHARMAVDRAREVIARHLKIRPEGVTFTSGGTEANNLALFGVVDAARAVGTRSIDIEIITTPIEHPSILNALDVLREQGVTVHSVPVDEEGLIVMSELEKLLSPKTLLVTCAYVNSEVGVVQDVRTIARMVTRVNEKMSHGGRQALVHIDASQAPLWLPCAMDSLGVDLMTLDAGKCYGPKGVGVLAHIHGVPLRAQIFGGDQEGALRPGTENVPLIVGCAEALKIAFEGHEARTERVSMLRDMFFEKLGESIPGVLINGSREERVANNCNVSIPRVDGEFAVVTLDIHGIAASTRSACAGTKGGGSHVVAAMTGDQDRASNTIRFTLGEETTEEDIVQTIKVLSEYVRSQRE